MTAQLVSDALAISGQWRHELDLEQLLGAALRPEWMNESEIDVVAIGKGARSMASATSLLLGPRVSRQLVITDELMGNTNEGGAGVELLVGDHPIAGPASERAGRRLLEFLGTSASDLTLFLLSGGASSLCAYPQAPLTIDDLAAVWDVALRRGLDITTLNQLRAATSMIGGGRILRHVRSKHSATLLMVDNVVSGARWVASGLTYEFVPDDQQFATLLERFSLEDSSLARRLWAAHTQRTAAMTEVGSGHHENRVAAEPGLLVEHASAEARRRGFRVVSLGAQVSGDVAAVSARFEAAIGSELARGDGFCLLGVGEVTVQVHGSGDGGRCQEFASSMVRAMAHFGREGVFVARASDGRDYLQGVAGAWIDRATEHRSAQFGIDWQEVLARNDSFHALGMLGQLIEGEPTGWNLCDLYVALFERDGATTAA